MVSRFSLSDLLIEQMIVPHSHVKILVISGLQACFTLLKGHSGFESGFFCALSAFGSSPNDTMHTN